MPSAVESRFGVKPGQVARRSVYNACMPAEKEKNGPATPADFDLARPQEAEAAQGFDTLETPERVDLEIDLAGVGSRSLAYIVDFILVFVVMFASSIALLLSGALLGTLAVVIWVIAIFLMWWFYFAFFEAVWTGQTPGKRLMGLRVQKVGGYPIGWPEALIRNFLRLVDMMMMSVPIGLIVMLFTRRHQRIGDLAAGTVVVREQTIHIEDLADLGFTAATAADGTEAARVTGGPELTLEEFELLRDFLQRRDDFDHLSRHRIGNSLAGYLRERLAEQGRLSETLRDRELEDEVFLVRLDQEYRGVAE